jgi:hypothetical protein
MSDNAFARLVSANRAKGGRHSPVYVWMRARHDALTATFEADGASWPTIAAMLTEAGLTDGTGKPPTAERARKCWHQVRKDVAAARAKTEARRKVRVSVPHGSTTPPPIQVPCEPWRQPDQPPAVDVVSPPAKPALLGDDDPMTRLRRTLNERSFRG